ncbi:unnamed protein product [Paramecium sonneborni]|uniref:Transmembrane protein n=1 Tax=Paramecium sonneborni TaxID=65129 RepID=A0A8S1RTT1_9CILI|nr:unnamed protein product [Paramecium sonneborni]
MGIESHWKHTSKTQINSEPINPIEDLVVNDFLRQFTMSQHLLEPIQLNIIRMNLNIIDANQINLLILLYPDMLNLMVIMILINSLLVFHLKESLNIILHNYLLMQQHNQKRNYQKKQYIHHEHHRNIINKQDKNNIFSYEDKPAYMLQFKFRFLVKIEKWNKLFVFVEYQIK